MQAVRELLCMKATSKAPRDRDEFCVVFGTNPCPAFPLATHTSIRSEQLVSQYRTRGRGLNSSDTDLTKRCARPVYRRGVGEVEFREHHAVCKHCLEADQLKVLKLTLAELSVDDSDEAR